MDDYIKNEMRHQRIPGLAMAIVRGADVRKQGYGLANLEDGAPVTTQTVFQIGSMTKQFTSFAVMLLVEEGKVSLDNKLGTYLPEVPAVCRDVTIRQLLSHTSGIKDYTEQPGLDAIRRLDQLPQQLLNIIANQPLDFPSGTRFAYSNTNYLLLGMLIEKVSKQSYDDFLTQRIFTPLEMMQTRVNHSADIIPYRAQGYSRIPGQTQNADYFSPSNAFGGGNLVSSMDDLVKWEEALSEHKLLKPESYTAMWTSASNQNDVFPYGFGWSINKQNGHRLISHAGNISGFSSAILRFPDDRLTVILLTNLGNFNADRIALGIAGRVDPALANPVSQPINDPDPATTLHLKHVFLGMMSGQMDPQDFSEKINRELGPLIQKGSAQAKIQAADRGNLESFDLVRLKTTQDGKELQYRAVFEYQMRVNVYVTLDSTGKITNWGVAGPAD
ncbi:MAG TPA: serine hydrolase domain-containing protein [Candidatus Acidoferrum sp.]|nr:serine hydrolase domain-containing protein [Candidatus Acidoferrum sp.]